MSKGRWDRNRAARTQKWDSDYAQLTGGLDQSSSALQIKSGRISYGLNFEEVFGKRGYTTIVGYERYDGHPEPSEADYWVLPFTAGNANISTQVFGQQFYTTPDTRATYLGTSLTSGSFAGGDAVGYILLLANSITDGIGSPSPPPFAAGDAIQNLSGDPPWATLTGPLEPSTTAHSFYRTAITLARTYRRNLIQAVPGAGPILGGAVFNGTVLAVRKNFSNEAATMYRASASGWQQVISGLAASRCRFAQYNFTGDATNQYLYMVNGRDRLIQIARDWSWTKAAPIYASESLSGSMKAVSTGAGQLFTVSPTARSYTINDDIIIRRVNNPEQWMRGKVAAYNAGTNQLTVDVTTAGIFDGSPHADWEIGLADYSDKPYLVQPHRNHLFLGYPGGQLQTSNLGDPLTYTTTATVFGLGQELTGMSSLKGKSLAVFCEAKVSILEGSSQLDWNMGDYTDRVGAVIDTIQDNDGNPIYLSAMGLTTLQATQNFGDVAASVMSRDVRPTLDAMRDKTVGSRMASGSSQYRLYSNDGGSLRMTLVNGGGSQVAGPNSVSSALVKYEHEPVCIFYGFMSGDECSFFGTAEGYVMEEEHGTSADGEPITYVIRLPFNHMKSPGIDKQFHKMELELRGASPVSLNYRQIFDYDDGTFGVGSGALDYLGSGDVFDVGAFDVMRFDLAEMFRAEAPLDGQGRNMALLIWMESDFIEPATLQGVLLYFTLLGVRP